MRSMKGDQGRKSWRAVVVMTTVMVMVMAMAMWEVETAKPSAAECKEEITVAIGVCMPVVYGNDPSPACCQRVRVTHLDCVCPIITPKVAAAIDVSRAVRLIEGCGRKVPRHYKCGAITTP